MRQAVLDFSLARAPGLDNFVCVHPVQFEVLAHVRMCLNSLAIKPAAALSPSYLWGDAGVGKTHLLQAVGLALQARGAQLAWMDADSAPDTPYPTGAEVLILDDVHLYTAPQQQQAFSWFVQAQTEQRWVLAAGRGAAAQLQMREDLRTRLGWGHVFALEALDDGQRRLVVEQGAKDRGLRLPPEVLDFVLVRFSRDLRSLFEMLESLDRYSLAQKRHITIPLVKKMLEEC